MDVKSTPDLLPSPNASSDSSPDPFHNHFTTLGVIPRNQSSRLLEIEIMKRKAKAKKQNTKLEQGHHDLSNSSNHICIEPVNFSIDKNSQSKQEDFDPQSPERKSRKSEKSSAKHKSNQRSVKKKEGPVKASTASHEAINSKSFETFENSSPTKKIQTNPSELQKPLHIPPSEHNNERVLAWGCNDFGQSGKSSDFNTSGMMFNSSAGACEGMFGKTIYSQEGLLNILYNKTIPGKGGEVVSLASGSSHNLLVTSENRVFGWGNGSSGQLGNGSMKSSYKLVEINLKECTSENDEIEVCSVACGSKHSIVLSKSGMVYGFGCNFDAQLSYDYAIDLYKTNLLSPRLLGPLQYQKIIKIACTARSSFFLVDDGSLLSCGHGGHGQLGHDQEGDEVSPRVIEYFNTENISIKDISCGVHHCLALGENGSVYMWGHRTGCGLAKDQLKPLLVKSLQRTCVVKIGCGYNHCMVLTSSGRVLTWGSNLSGQLGHGEFTSSDNRWNSGNDSTLRAESRWGNKIRPGSKESVRKSSAGSVGRGRSTSSRPTSSEKKLCGKSSSEKLLSLDTPREVEKLLGIQIIDIGGGDNFSCAIESNGRLYMWGKNENLIICNDSSLCQEKETVSQEDRCRWVFYTPVMVNTNGIPVKALSCGAWHVCATVGSVATVQFKNDQLEKDCLLDEERLYRIKKKLGPIPAKKEEKESKVNDVADVKGTSVDTESNSEHSPKQSKGENQIIQSNTSEENKSPRCEISTPQPSYENMKEELLKWLKRTESFDSQCGDSEEEISGYEEQEPSKLRSVLKTKVRNFLKNHYQEVDSKSIEKNIERLMASLDSAQIISVSKEPELKTNGSLTPVTDVKHPTPVKTASVEKEKKMHPPIKINTKIGVKANSKEVLIMSDIKSEEIEKEKHRRQLLIKAEERKKVLNIINSVSKSKSPSSVSSSTGQVSPVEEPDSAPPSNRIWESPEYIVTENGERILVRKFKGGGSVGSELEKNLISEYDDRTTRAHGQALGKEELDEYISAMSKTVIEHSINQEILGSENRGKVLTPDSEKRSIKRSEQTRQEVRNLKYGLEMTEEEKKRQRRLKVAQVAASCIGQNAENNNVGTRRFAPKVRATNSNDFKRAVTKKKKKRLSEGNLSDERAQKLVFEDTSHTEKGAAAADVFKDIVKEVRDIKATHCKQSKISIWKGKTNVSFEEKDAHFKKEQLADSETSKPHGDAHICRFRGERPKSTPNLVASFRKLLSGPKESHNRQTQSLKGSTERISSRCSVREYETASTVASRNRSKAKHYSRDGKRRCKTSLSQYSSGSHPLLSYTMGGRGGKLIIEDVGNYECPREGSSSSKTTITSKSKIKALDEGMKISKKRGKMHYKTTENIYKSPQPAVIATPLSRSVPRDLPRWE